VSIIWAVGITQAPPGLLELTHLKSLDLGGGGWSRARGTIVPNQVAGWLDSLSSLAQLEELYLAWTDCPSLAFTSALPTLKKLSCRGTPVSDLGPLGGLPNLVSLNFSDTCTTDLAPLAGAGGLKRLVCVNTAINDLAPLAGLGGLEQLDLFDSAIADLALLAGLPGLRELWCGYRPMPEDGFLVSVRSDPSSADRAGC